MMRNSICKIDNFRMNLWFFLDKVASIVLNYYLTNRQTEPNALLTCLKCYIYRKIYFKLFYTMITVEIKLVNAIQNSWIGKQSNGCNIPTYSLSETIDSMHWLLANLLDLY